MRLLIISLLMGGVGGGGDAYIHMVNNVHDVASVVIN